MLPPPSRLALPKNPTRHLRGVYWRPSLTFLRELSTWLQGHRVLEVYAGNGYLAAWLANAGIDVTATSRLSGHDAHDFGMYFDVEELEATEAVDKHGDMHDVLLVCWPVTSESVIRAVRRWGPAKPVVYVGEVTCYEKNHLGGCASDAFFKAIEPTHRFGSYKGNMLEQAFVCHLRPDRP